MKKQELMVGNYFIDTIGNYCQAGSVQQVESINYDGVNQWSDMGASGHCRYRNMQPIPLTEEWLVKLGFVKDGKYDYLLKRDGFEIWNSCDFHTDNGDKFLFIGNMPDLEMRFIHVHQLQNLYFALTGQEL